MIRIFASLQFPEKYGYKFNSDSYESGSINPQFRMFETMGDNLTQHSRDWAVTKEYLADFIASLFAELMTLPMDDSSGFVREVSYHFRHQPSEAAIKFCAGLIWKESDSSYTKRRYYSIALEKVSSSESKRHDKRFEEMRDWMDGEPKAVARLLLPDYATAWKAYCHAEALKDWFQEGGKGWGYGYAAEFLAWFENDSDSWGKAAALHMAFSAAQQFFECWRLRSCCINNLENMTRSIASKRAEAETAAGSEVA